MVKNVQLTLDQSVLNKSLLNALDIFFTKNGDVLSFSFYH